LSEGIERINFRRIIRDDKSVEKLNGNELDSTHMEGSAKETNFDNTSTRRMSQEELNNLHDEQIAKHKDLMDKRKKYCFYRSSLTSQLKQHQIKPKEFGKYGDEDIITTNSYHSPVLDKFPTSIQY
jgi:hypothetical protein